MSAVEGRAVRKGLRFFEREGSNRATPTLIDGGNGKRDSYSKGRRRGEVEPSDRRGLKGLLKGRGQRVGTIEAALSHRLHEQNAVPGG